jgi:hypothetical protein
MKGVYGQQPDRRTYLGIVLVAPFHMCNAVGTNDNGPVAALERPLPLLGAQRFSTTFNTVQHQKY